MFVGGGREREGGADGGSGEKRDESAECGRTRSGGGEERDTKGSNSDVGREKQRANSVSTASGGGTEPTLPLVKGLQCLRRPKGIRP